MKAKPKYNQGKTVKLQISARVEKKYSHWTALVANPSPSQSNSWIQNFLHKTPRGNSLRNLVRKKKLKLPYERSKNLSNKCWTLKWNLSVYRSGEFVKLITSRYYLLNNDNLWFAPRPKSYEANVRSLHYVLHLVRQPAVHDHVQHVLLAQPEGQPVAPARGVPGVPETKVHAIRRWVQVCPSSSQRWGSDRRETAL